MVSAPRHAVDLIVARAADDPDVRCRAPPKTMNLPSVLRPEPLKTSVLLAARRAAQTVSVSPAATLPSLVVRLYEKPCHRRDDLDPGDGGGAERYAARVVALQADLVVAARRRHTTWSAAVEVSAAEIEAVIAAAAGGDVVAALLQVVEAVQRGIAGDGVVAARAFIDRVGVVLAVDGDRRRYRRAACRSACR